MTPPNFPQGMTLYSIGYAALKYPELPQPLEVPLTNQVGLLQRIPTSSQNHMIAQIASQYLPALIEYQCSDDPQLHDRSSPQFYFSSALCLLNFLNGNPDVCKRIIEHPALIHDIVEKLLEAKFEAEMRACKRPALAPPIPAPTFEDDFGSVLQFVSTMMLWKDYKTMHPRFQELLPKLKEWKKKYKGIFIAKISDRIIEQFTMDPTLSAAVKEMQRETLSCGIASCGDRQDLTVCGACKIQRYCGKEHQKKDWKYHKEICNKGLVESNS